MSRGVKILIGAAIAGAAITAAHIGANAYAFFKADDALNTHEARVAAGLEHRLEYARSRNLVFPATQERYNELMAKPEVSAAVQEHNRYENPWYSTHSPLWNGLEGIAFASCLLIAGNLALELRDEKKRKKELEELKATYARGLKELKEGYAREEEEMEAKIKALMEADINAWQGCAQ